MKVFDYSTNLLNHVLLFFLKYLFHFLKKSAKSDSPTEGIVLTTDNKIIVQLTNLVSGKLRFANFSKFYTYNYKFYNIFFYETPINFNFLVFFLYL